MKNRFFSLLTFFAVAAFSFLGLSSSHAAPPTKETVVVMPVHGASLTPQVRATLTNTLIGQLIKAQRYNFLSGNVVEESMRTALKVQAKEASCEDLACLRLVAKSVGTDLVLTTRVLKEGGTYYLDSKIDNIGTGSVIAQVDDECINCNLGSLKNSIKGLAQELVKVDLSQAVAGQSSRGRQSSRGAEEGSSAGDLVDNGDGTITDTKTNLMWAKDDSATTTKECMDWVKARKYTKKLKTGGYNDWRLPTLSELKTIYDESKSNKIGFAFKDYRERYPLHMEKVFGDPAAFLVWSSETKGVCCARLLHFHTGYVGKQMKYYCREAGVRPVRDGGRRR